ncbi:leucine-rich repeat-containing protein [Tanacetum coccineum]
MSNRKLLSMIFLFFLVTTTYACHKEEREALLVFTHNLYSMNYTYNDECGSSYYNTMTIDWNTSTDCCNWSGVTCDPYSGSGDITSLNLGCGKLQGSIDPRSSLFNLRHLTFLDLSNNKLNGTLPSWLFTFPSLQYLYLQNNMFSGKVPFESFALPSLQELDLSGNTQLAGHIDVQTFLQLTNLTFLSLSSNNFSGEIWELDTLLSSLRNLEHLDLSYSGFSVTTKNTNHYVNPGFRYLYLASCRLKVFPNSFRAMKQLQRLDLSHNEIHGQIPHWVGEIGGNYRLRMLNLSHNYIIGLAQFECYGLYQLYLRSNLIQGPFPPSICNMSSLMYLDMSNNRFGGLIPQCFGNMSLVMINMGNNRFHGTIPSFNDDRNNLWGLILKGNQFEGEVPRSLSKFKSLIVIDFGNNHLNGTFPGWLGDLPNLQVLILKSNNFHGHMQPSSTVESPFQSLRVLDLSHNQFVGQLPAKYFQVFSSMKNVDKSTTTPRYVYIGLYYSLNVVVKGVDRYIPRLIISLTIIDLSNNYFERGIPEIIGNLSSLKVLNLSHNSLYGPIPDSLGKLSEIESFDLSWNQLTGNIPQSLAGIKGLAVLDLSQNHLVGRIPEGIQFNTICQKEQQRQTHLMSSSFAGNLGAIGFTNCPRRVVTLGYWMWHPTRIGDGISHVVNEKVNGGVKLDARMQGSQNDFRAKQEKICIYREMTARLLKVEEFGEGSDLLSYAVVYQLRLRLNYDFLVACAGPALNVRVEHVSRDRYKDGCALAEVVSSFDTMGDHISNDTHEREYVELEGKTKRAIEVRFKLSLFIRQLWACLAVQALSLTIDHLKQLGLERILCLGASFRPFTNDFIDHRSSKAIWARKNFGLGASFRPFINELYN